MNKEEYYNLMEHMNTGSDFDTIHKNWFECYTYIIKKFANFTPESIKSLFYDWDMENWKAMHLENTEYKDYTKEQLKEAFCGECWYISDRTSYDRLFRTHWLFLRAFEDEMNKIKYPELFNK
jgi:hypothetical protein